MVVNKQKTPVPVAKLRFPSREEDSLELNEPAIRDFIHYGVTAPGDSFFLEDSHINTQSFSSFLDRYELKHKHITRDLLNLLNKELTGAVGRLLKKKTCSFFALSGGCDTRLILAILLTQYPESLKELNIYTRLHPDLVPDSDRDVSVAKILSQKFKFPLAIESYRLSPTVYLDADLKEGERVLSGLFGGELLGGALLDGLMFSPDSGTHKSESDGNFDDFLREFWSKNKFSSENLLAFYYYLLRNSYMTGLYKTPAWLQIDCALEFTESPFLDDDFLDLLFSVHPDVVYYYQVYVRILEVCYPEFIKIPVNNSYVAPYPFIERVDWGVEPKSLGDMRQERARSLDLSAHSVHSAHKMSDNQNRVLDIIRENEEGEYSEYLKSVLTQAI